MIIINIDVMLAKRKMSVTELSILKNGKAKAIKLETLSKTGEVLQGKPGDVLEYVPGETEE